MSNKLAIITDVNGIKDHPSALTPAKETEKNYGRLNEVQISTDC
jgi:hypothetical protein